MLVRDRTTPASSSPEPGAARGPRYRRVVPLTPAANVSTAPLVSLGLLGGYLTARETGIRPLGGLVLGLAGVYAGRTWLAKRGPAVTGVLSAVYVLGFGASHPLAKRIGAWPSVLTVTAASAAASWALSDRD